MTEKKKYRCRNCGNRFEVDVLTEEERREAKRKNERVYQIACTKCHRLDVAEGWY